MGFDVCAYMGAVLMVKPYGCNNSERKHGYHVVQPEIALKGVEMVAVYITDISSKECRYDNRNNDPKCSGCVK